MSAKVKIAEEIWKAIEEKPAPGRGVAGIYSITHRDSGKRYVGSAKNVAARWRLHRHQLRRGTHHCAHLQRAFDKYGEDVFDWTILEEIPDPAALLGREQYYIDLFGAADGVHGYNSRPVAKSNLGWRPSDETRERMRRGQTGRKHSAETVSKRAESNRGRKHTPESRAKIGAAHRGKTISAEAKAAVSAAQAGRTRPPELRERISAKLRGIRRTPEQLENMRRGAQLRERRRRERGSQAGDGGPR
jgi:group I intron endonuclease